MILFIQTAFLGDLLLSIPALKRLRNLYPHKKIHLLCRKNLGSLLLENGLVDTVFDDFRSTKPTLTEVRNTFHKQHYDLLVCPHESFRSNCISALISADHKIGFSNFYNKIIFGQRLTRPLFLPEVLRQMSLLQFIDEDLKDKFLSIASQKSPFLQIPDWSSMALERYKKKDDVVSFKKKYGLSQQQEIVCLAPGSVWATKQWGVEKYSMLAQKLLQKNKAVVVVGSPSEKEIAFKIKQNNPDVLDFCGKTNLSELAEIVACADHLVCNDSGAMHIGSMVNVPTVSIFGPTVQRFGYQPWNAQAVVLENTELNCRPCSSHGTATCPIGTHECMTSIEVQRVLEFLAPR